MNVMSILDAPEQCLLITPSGKLDDPRKNYLENREIHI